jgi:hypothetical protein
MSAFCVYGTEHSGSIKGGKFVYPAERLSASEVSYCRRKIFSQVSFRLLFQRCPIVILGLVIDYTEVYRGFPQFFQANSGLASLNGLRPLLSTYCCSTLHLAEILTASLNESKYK